MLEVALGVEVLPILVFAPALDRLFLAERIEVLQGLQRGHHLLRQRRAPSGGGELRAPLVGARLRINQLTSPCQLVAVVNQVYQLVAGAHVVICALVN
jgi:hypothetical protein